MTYVARCSLPPRPLVGTARFSHADGENMIPKLWAFAPEGWVMRESASAIDAAGTAASLTFRTPAGCADDPCALVLDADATGDLRATVNDMPAAVEVARDTITVLLPAGAADTWVTFTSSSGAPLGLRVRSMRLVPSGAG